MREFSPEAEAEIKRRVEQFEIELRRRVAEVEDFAEDCRRVAAETESLQSGDTVLQA